MAFSVWMVAATVILLINVHTSVASKTNEASLRVKVTTLADDVTQMEATDGVRYLLAVHQTSSGDVNCYTDQRTRAALSGVAHDVIEDAATSQLVQSVMGDPQALSVTLGVDQQLDLFWMCLERPARAVVVLAEMTNSTSPAQVTRPTTPAQVTRPTTPPQVTRPTTPAQMTRPTTPAQVTRPTTPPQVTRPTTPPQVTRPTTPAQVTRPTTPAQVTRPTTPPQVTRPTTPPQVTRPTTPPQVTRPTTPPQVTRPTTPPQVTRPTTPPQVTRPTTPPQVTRPTTPVAPHRLKRRVRAKRALFNRFTVFPGTKWCGAGHTARHYNDLGTFRQTDSCCREHDHCRLTIPAWSRLDGLTNWHPWTVSHCDCDDTFNQCLKNVYREDAAYSVRNLFFGLLRIKCFTRARDYWGNSVFSYRK